MSFFQMFFLRSVDSILSHLSSGLVKLEKLAAKERARVLQHEEKVRAIQAEAAFSADHADRADRVAAKLRELIS